MAEREPFQDWLEQFNRDWWRAPGDAAGSAASPSVGTGAPPAPSSELASRLERLAEERARLQQRIDELTRENTQFRERQADVETQLAEFNASLSRARQTYEGKISQLEAEKAALEAQVKSQESFQRSLEAVQADSKQLREELRLQADKKLEADRAALGLNRRIRDLEEAAAKLREERAVQEGAIAELRRQGDHYQQRLIHAKELTDSDVAMLRQEIRLFLEEFRNMADTIKRDQQQETR